MDEIRDAATNLIGEEAARKLQSAHIALVWERDQVIKMVDDIAMRKDTRQSEIKLEYVQRWAKSWKRAAKKYYEKWMMQDMLADLGHLVQTLWMEQAKNARADAVKVALECQALQTELDEYRDWEQNTLAGKATDCLKGKAHEWRLEKGNRVACRLCGESGTPEDLAQDVNAFYAMRDDRDRLKRELDGYRDWEKSTLGKALLRIDVLQARVETLEVLIEKHCDAGWKLVDEKKALQDQLVGVKFALDNWRRRALSAEEKLSRRCETCRHLRSGVPCMVCELLRLHVHGETTKTFGCSLWEAQDDDSTS